MGGKARERGGPGAGTGERDCGKDEKTGGGVLVHHSFVFVALILQLGDQTFHLRTPLADGGEDFPDKEDNKRDGEDIGQNTHGQSHTGRQTQPHGNGDSTPQFDERQHGDKEGCNDLSDEGAGDPDPEGLNSSEHIKKGPFRRWITVRV